MKKLIALLLLTFGVNAQTLVKMKQVGDGLGTGSIVVTGAANGACTYSAASAILAPYATTAALTSSYVPYVGANSFTTSNNITAGSFISTGQSTLNTLYVPSTFTSNGALLANSTGTFNGALYTASNFSAGAQSTISTLYVPNTATVNGAFLANSTATINSGLQVSTGTTLVNVLKAVSTSTLVGNMLVGPATFGSSLLHIARFSKGTGTVDIGESTSARSAIWLHQNTPSATNYAIQSDGTALNLNCIGGINLRVSTTQYGQFANVANGGSFINSYFTVGSTAVAAGQPTLNVIGTMSVSSTPSVNGLQLVSGGYSVTTKVIDATAGDAVTINSPIGQFRKDNSGTTFVLTNSQITANSVIMLTAANAAIDATATGWTISKGAGSATITFNAAPTANFNMMFMIMN